MDKEIIEKRNIDDEELTAVSQNNDELPESLESVFSGFAAHCDENYYKIIGYLTANDFKKVVDLAHTDISNDTPDPNKLRLYAHLILLIKYGNYGCDNIKADEIMLLYSKMLITLEMFTLVPYYLSKLDMEEAQKQMVNFLYGNILLFGLNQNVSQF